MASQQEELLRTATEMSAKTLKLLADCSSTESTAPSSPVLGKLRDAVAVSEAFAPSAPPGLELLAPAKKAFSESAELAESSSGSTYFDDSELASIPSDGRLWSQAAQFDAGDMEVVACGGAQNLILSTTPLSPPWALNGSLSSTASVSWFADDVFSAGAAAPPADAGFAAGYDGAGFAVPEMLQMQVSIPMGADPMEHHAPLPATVGSAAHEEGTCKPCAFVYTKGCQSGMPQPQKSLLHHTAFPSLLSVEV